MEPAVGVVVGGRYHLRRPLGKGGMASVWLAYDRSEKESVALKFMSDEFASQPDARRRFEREAIAPRQITSPYVVKMKDHGVEDGTLYIVMELLDGEDLFQRIQREGRMSTGAAGKLITQVAEGLHEAHKLGIIHRDLKPGNIFLARVGNQEIPKIVDFGIVKAKHTGADEEATKTGTILGTMNYISPEQLKSSKDVDHRSDLWSLAVILLRLITGKQPFSADDYTGQMLRICTGPIPLPSSLAPELNLPLELDEFFERALDRDRTRRFQTAPELAEQFNRFLIGLPPEPTSSTAPLAKSGPHAAERGAALAEIEEATVKATQVQRVVSDGDDLPTVPVDLGAVKAVLGEKAVPVAEGAVGAARMEEAATVVEKNNAVDDDAPTFLKIDVALDSAAPLAASKEPKRDESEAVASGRSAVTERRGAAAKAMPEEKPGGGKVLAGVVIAVVVVAAALGAWKFIVQDTHGGASPDVGAQSPAENVPVENGATPTGSAGAK